MIGGGESDRPLFMDSDKALIMLGHCILVGEPWSMSTTSGVLRFLVAKATGG